jgi:cell fate regulator YaaT (PSP1 superfamily)
MPAGTAAGRKLTKTNPNAPGRRDETRSNMQKIIGIRFKPAGKVYDFDCGAFVLKLGDHVIVETEQGLGFGMVATKPKPLEEVEPRRPLKKVFRLATENDFCQVEKNRETERFAHQYCLQCIQKLGLEMHLFAVESTFDANKLTFFFTADGRVDFRQLVKMLVRRMGVRIEMRQMGIRNQAKMCGGIGRCGREICCSKFIEKFGPVSIRMAKEQGLSLNPTKISGLCGRLMCCLTFEFETYRELKDRFPKVGRVITTPSGRGKVIRHNVLAGRFTVQLEEGMEEEFDLDAFAPNPKKKVKTSPRSNE